MFYGRGAGGAPTASAVLGDLVAVARNKLTAAAAPGESATPTCAIRPMGEAVTRYHISLDVADKAGVLAAVATVVRRARRLDPDGAPGRARRRRELGDRHAPGVRRGALGHRRATFACSTSCGTWQA